VSYIRTFGSTVYIDFPPSLIGAASIQVWKGPKPKAGRGLGTQPAGFSAGCRALARTDASNRVRVSNSRGTMRQHIVT